MSLETSYEVLEMLRDDGVQTFRAKEKATGRVIELHLFVPFGRPENKSLFERLKTLPLETRRKFLDTGIDGSTPYLVTDPLPASRGCKTWLDELIAGASAPPVTGGSSSAHDDGVQIIQAGQWRTGTPIPESLITKPLGAPQPSKEHPSNLPGDFTRVFQAPDFSQIQSPSQPPPQQSASPSPAPPSPSPFPGMNESGIRSATQPGDFTRLFQTAEFAHPTAAAESPIADAGEFTGMFQAKQIAPGPASPPAEPAHEASPVPGEFTRMFEAPSTAGFKTQQNHPVLPNPGSAPREAAPAAPTSTEFTKYFENPLSPMSQGMGQGRSMAAPASSPVPQPAAKHVGEFTSVFGAPSQAPSSGPGPYSYSPPPPPPPAAGNAFGAQPSATGAFAAPAWQQPQPPQTLASGPSEYTRMMGAGAVPGMEQSVFQPAPPAAPPVQSNSPAGNKQNLPLYIAIGVVVVLIIVIALFLLMRNPATLPAAK